MIGKNNCEFIGKLISKPSLSLTNSGYISGVTIIVNSKKKINKIKLIAFGEKAKVLHDMGKKNDKIYAECRVESQDGNSPSFVVDRFSLFCNPSQYKDNK